jgi:uroporphyrinogen III methyltransferase/synthase
VIPGYEDTTKEESAIDWAKLATGVGTLVILMAVKNLDMLVRKLIENGRGPETPVAVVRWGTRPDQETIVSTLENITSEVKDKEIKPPAVVVIGEVVKLREKLKWYEHKPMFGQRILVTREHATGFEPLEELGAEILEFPTIEIVPPDNYGELDAAIEKISTYTWLIFTSGNGVRYFLDRFLGLDRDIRDLKGIKICAIGTKTAAEIKSYGMKVDLIPEEFRAEGLIETFLRVHGQRSTGTNLQGMKFLLPRAEVAREIFPERVRELGGEIDVPVAYRAIKPDLHGKRLKRFLQEGRITIATFTSAATFTNFLEIIGSGAHALLKEVMIAVIGPVTAKAVEKTGLTVDIMPEEPTIEAMVAEIIQKAAREKQ